MPPGPPTGSPYTQDDLAIPTTRSWTLNHPKGPSVRVDSRLLTLCTIASDAGRLPPWPPGVLTPWVPCARLGRSVFLVGGDPHTPACDPRVPGHPPLRAPACDPRVPGHPPLRTPACDPRLPAHPPLRAPACDPRVPGHPPLRAPACDPRLPAHPPPRASARSGVLRQSGGGYGYRIDLLREGVPPPGGVRAALAEPEAAHPRSAENLAGLPRTPAAPLGLPRRPGVPSAGRSVGPGGPSLGLPG